MKKTRILALITLASLLVTGTAAGCSSEEADVSIPFSDITWENSLDDIIAVEGDEYESYDSVYNGTTYSFPKTFDGIEGEVKYMFDDNDELMCIAWQCSTADASELENVYSDIHSDLEDTYGESGYNSDSHSSNRGDVWYREEGDIVLSAVTTSTMNALLYSYLHPDVSNQEK